jgi:hypothetical protein
MTQYKIENIEWVRSEGCVLSILNTGIFPLFSNAVILDSTNNKKCTGFVSVLREYTDKLDHEGIIRATIRLDTTNKIPLANDIILLTPVF